MFIQALSESGAPLTTKQVANRVGCSRRRAFGKLSEFEESGRVYSNRKGNSREWSLGATPDLEDRTLADYAAANLSAIPDLDANGMVIAIQKPHSQDIMSGRKRIEFRRGSIKRENEPDIAFLYEPSPTQAIIGVFEIPKIERLPVPELVEMGVENTPSTKESLQEYFAGSEVGTAIHIARPRAVRPPVSLNYRDGNQWRFTPPQSFYYVDPEEFINKFPQVKDDNPPDASQESGLSSNTS
ncbi:ASCH domain-containing protein [Halobaculum sp. P14]|uniref:ASCH domain-containing protein n=1 Tax=Halobaculum sp. P14 TaxID=3421638 RepID=UPI003EC10C86